MVRISLFMAMWLGIGSLLVRADDFLPPSGNAPRMALDGAGRQAERKMEQTERELAQRTEVSKWYAHDAIRIDAAEFVQAIKKMQANPALMIPPGAVAISPESFSMEERQDLDLAVSGLMRAFSSPGPDSNFAYIESRGEKLGLEHRQSLEKFLKRTDSSSLEELSDRDFLLRYWHLSKLKNVWSGFVPELSGWAIWDGKKVLSSRTVPLVSDQAHLPTSEDEALLASLQAMRTVHHLFRPQHGTLEEAIACEKSIPVCEVKLIVEYEPEWSKSRAVYLCRFWLNRAAGKWQPLSLHCYSDPRFQKSFPSLLF